MNLFLTTQKKRRIVTKKKTYFALAYLILLVYISAISECNAEKVLRRSRIRTTFPPTSREPKNEVQPALESSNLGGNENTANTTTIRPTRKRRLRVRKVRVQKRQGPFIPEEVDTIPGPRDHLYQVHSDEVVTPDHYYSPIRRERNKPKKKLFRKVVYQNAPEQIRPHHPPHEHQSSSHPNANVDFVRRDSPSRHRYKESFHGNGNQENSDEYTTTTQPPPKNYAFAYAVRDEDDNTEDFSHKEARDGKLTMGEYRINLPDGRIQVVRYTAGENIGYKADVTYEGEGDDHPSKPGLTAKPKHVSKVAQGNDGYLPPGLSGQTSNAGPSPTPRPRPNKKGGRSKKINRYQSQYLDPFKPLPSVTPSDNPRSGPPTYEFTNNHGPHSSQIPSENDDHKFFSNFDDGRKFHPGSGSKVPLRLSPDTSPTSRPKTHKRRPVETFDGGFDSGPSPSPYPQGFSLRPKNIFDQIEPNSVEYTEQLTESHNQSPRAGPVRRKKNHDVRPSYDNGFSRPQLLDDINALKKSYRSNYDYDIKPKQKPQKQKNVKITPEPPTGPAPLYNEPGPGNYYGIINQPPPTISSSSLPKYDPSPTPAFNYVSRDRHEFNGERENRRHPPSFGSYTPISFNSGQSKRLIPIEDFKAGPARKVGKNKKSRHEYPKKEFVDPNQPKPVNPLDNARYKEPYHYYNSQHPSYHHGGYAPRPVPPAGLRQQQLNDAPPPPPSPSPTPDSSYTVEFPGGKHSFYLKSSSNKGKASEADRSSPFSGGEQFYQTLPHSLHHSPTQKPHRKKSPGNGSGLVYFETPGSGPRPSDVGFRNVLSSFPNMPKSHSPISPTSSSVQPIQLSALSSTNKSRPKTIIHPYEVGRKDYGQTVAYKNSFNTPSSGEKQEAEKPREDGPETSTPTAPPSRDYLFEREIPVRFRIRQRPQRYRTSSTPSPLLLSPSPTPTLSVPHHSPSPSPYPYQFHDYQQGQTDLTLLNASPEKVTYETDDQLQSVLQAYPSPSPSPISHLQYEQPGQGGQQPQYLLSGVPEGDELSVDFPDANVAPDPAVGTQYGGSPSAELTYAHYQPQYQYQYDGVSS